MPQEPRRTSLRQRADVVRHARALEHGDEGMHQFTADRVGDLALALARQAELFQRGLVRFALDQRQQGTGSVECGGCAVFQQREEAVALAENGLQRKHGAPARLAMMKIL